MNYAITKIMTSEYTRLLIDGVTIERVDKYNWLGHTITLGKENRVLKSSPCPLT